MKTLRRHSLQQLKILAHLTRKKEKSRAELMFLLSELPGHGLFDFKKVVTDANILDKSPIFTASLKKKISLWKHCNSELQSSKFLRNKLIMEKLYGNEIFFSKNSEQSKAILIIAFTTMHNNFFFANSVLASLLSDLGYSFLILKDPVGHFYLNGVQGLGVNLSSSCTALDTFIKNNGFTDVKIVSYSAGGFASMLYASRIKNVSNVLSFSPRTNYLDNEKNMSGKSFDAVRDQVPPEFCGNLREMVDFSKFSTSIVYGVENMVDKENAANLAGLKNVSIAGLENCGHDTPAALLRSRSFKQVLSETLFNR